jgi:pyrroline-5-carboxylate reductase
MAARKFGIIGAGSMGEALLRGLLESRTVTARDVLIAEKDDERAEEIRTSYRVKRAADAGEAVEKCDVNFLAVKPDHVNTVLRETGTSLDKKKLLISVAAGVSLFQIESRLRSPARLVRVMPNTPALVGEGATAVCFGHSVTAADRKLVMKVFRAVGRAVEVPESLMDAVTGLSGSGPAYALTLIQGMADGGVKAGLPRAMALELAAQTVLGAARLVLETGAHPMELRDQVASPGGTTIEGIAVLEEAAFTSAAMDAVCAAAERSRNLSKK